MQMRVHPIAANSRSRCSFLDERKPKMNKAIVEITSGNNSSRFQFHISKICESVSDLPKALHSSLDFHESSKVRWSSAIAPIMVRTLKASVQGLNKGILSLNSPLSIWSEHAKSGKQISAPMEVGWIANPKKIEPSMKNHGFTTPVARLFPRSTKEHARPIVESRMINA